MERKFLLALLIIALLSVPLSLSAEDHKGASPPARVVVSEVTTENMPPMGTFVGTVFYSEVSDVATEVAGIVERVRTEEGQKVEKGEVFIRLNADIMKKRLQATKAGYEQSLAELEKARLDLVRVENLYKQQSVAQQLYDEHRFRVKSLEKKAESLQAETEGLKAEVEKKTVRAPFTGVILKKYLDRGEWVSSGQPVARLARDDTLEVVVDVPEAAIRFARSGDKVQVVAGGLEIVGTVFALIPQGDLATRTFPVKIRVPQMGHLMEGMEAKVTLPVGEGRSAFVVPRDALVSVFGVDTIFIVQDSTAQATPVEVMGFQGGSVGIRAKGLEKGMKVVTKGNERLQAGRPVEIIQP